MLDVEKTPLQFTNGGNTYLGMTVKDLRGADVREDVILEAVKAHLSVSIDTAAENARSIWITPGTGQSMEYDRVQQEADAAIKAPSSATAAKYPMLAATIGIDIDPDTGKAAADVLGVARSVQAARDFWTEKGAAIRAARLKGKAAIAEAATVDAAIVAAAGVAWPAPPG